MSFDSDLTQHRRTISAMTDTMACRGPDDEGTWVRPRVALGHRRLAVIDVENGRQPMSANVGRGEVVLVYSGEVYNFAELRAELRDHGHRFTTRSDTEVVLRGYLEWQERVVDKLNGMYAFAIWDARWDSLLLVRDRMGIKPLYYYPTGDGVLFGSEPKAILANPVARRVVDADGLRELMAYTRAPRWSLWQGMSEVEPGSFVRVDSAGLSDHVYWQLRTRPHAEDEQETVAHVRALLDDTVRRQLVADVPRCVLLSGGLDSSAITGLAAKQLMATGERLRTFSVDLAGQQDNFQEYPLRGTPDAPYVRDVVDSVPVEHQTVLLDPMAHGDTEVRRAVLSARDIPVGLGDVDLSLYLLFKAIRNSSTVALSGEGADEVFGGYPWFHDQRVRESGTFPWLAHQGVTIDKTPLLRSDVREILDISGYIADQYRDACSRVEYLDTDDALERQMRTISNLFLTRFIRMPLDRKDRVAMAVGLEVRVPFCDHRIAEYVYNVPWSTKTMDGREKSILRQAVPDAVPDSVLWRPKSGYPSTQDPRYTASLQEQAREVLADSGNPLFDLVDRHWLEQAVLLEPTTVRRRVRFGLDWILDLYHWLDIYRPTVELK